jgi:AbiU2
MEEAKKKLSTTTQLLFDDIEYDAQWLHGKWKIFNQLFLGNLERIDLLNETTPEFFLIIQEILLENFILVFSRLTDRERIARNDNASLRQLIHHIQSDGFSDLSETLVALLQKLEDSCKVFREKRNKISVHKDLLVVLQVLPEPPDFSVSDINKSLELLDKFLNAIHLYFEDKTVTYNMFYMRTGGNSIIEVLKDSKEYRKLIEIGKIQP